LFNAYFTSGIDLSKSDNIIKAAIEAGLDEKEVAELLGDENALMQVSLAEQELYKLGISGVPFYIVNNKYGISGAQATETFIKAFREINTQSVSQGATCDTDAKNC
jgi:predicted DsbA family dithiol-disulfide isomerase